MLPVIVYDENAAECELLCRIVRGYLKNKGNSSIRMEAFTTSEKKALDYIRSNAGICLLIIGFHDDCEHGVRLFQLARCMNRDHYILLAINNMEQMAFITENCLRPAGFLFKTFTLEKAQRILAQIENDYANLQTEKKDGYIVINNEMGTHRILTDTILYIEAIEKKVLIWTQRQSFSLRGTLNQLMEMLPTEHFLRCHRSFIVNTSVIVNVDYRNACLVLESGDRVFFARAYKNAIRQVWEGRSDAS